MSIYHLHVTTGSRSTGQSAAAKAAYLARIDAYGRGRKEVTYLESGNMPQWAMNPRSDRRSAVGFAYWQAADAHERANGRLFKEVEFALPRELDENQRIKAVQEFVKAVTSKVDGGSLPYAFAIHTGKGRNPHCHVLVSERIYDGNDRMAETWFKRAGSSNGGARKTDKLKPEQWLLTVRERWATICNRHLWLAGQDARIDHRSHAAQGRTEVPGAHVGVAGMGMARRGRNSERRAMQDKVEHSRQQQCSLSRQKRIVELGLQCVAISQFLEPMNRVTYEEEELLRIERRLGKCQTPPSGTPTPSAIPIPDDPLKDEDAPGGFGM